MNDWIFNALLSLMWPVVIIGLIIYAIGRKKHAAQKHGEVAVSPEDAVRQWMMLLSVLFFGVTLLAINKDFGDPLSISTILLITIIVGFVISYYFKISSVLIFSLFGFVIWWGWQASLWIDHKDIRWSSITAGVAFISLLYFVLGYLHEKQQKLKRFSVVYVVLGIFPITGFLFFFSSKPGLSALSESMKGGLPFESWQIVVSLLLFSVSIVGVTIYNYTKKLMHPAEAIAIVLLMLLFGSTTIMAEQSWFTQLSGYSYYNNQLSNEGIMWAILFNVILFFELLGIIFSGYLRRETWLINLGTVFLFLLIVLKYFDWFFTFLDKSIFFIIAGILLFGVGWFMERGRRYVIATMKDTPKV